MTDSLTATLFWAQAVDPDPAAPGAAIRVVRAVDLAAAKAALGISEPGLVWPLHSAKVVAAMRGLQPGVVVNHRTDRRPSFYDRYTRGDGTVDVQALADDGVDVT